MKLSAAALSLSLLAAAGLAAEPPWQAQPPGQAQPPAQTPPAQAPPTFKSSVDLVPVDINVIDRNGRPVADLTAADFALKVDGRPRKIRSAQFIAVTRDVERAPVGPADYSSNAASTGGRLIMLVIDQGNIGLSRGKYAIAAANRFVSRLTPADRVGLVTIPGAGPQIDFTANHALVQNALQRIVGLSDQGERQVNEIGLSEALALQRGNEQLIQTILERECSGLSAGADLQSCRDKLMAQARALYVDVHGRTRDSLLSLRVVMDRLARTVAPKTVVYVSEGLMIDRREMSEVAWIGPLAARAQITFYVMQLEPPMFDSTNAQNSPTRGEDIQLAQESLGHLAGVARGAVFRIISGADMAFNRLALELSGYYLLSFEPEADDRDGKDHKIKVELPGRKDVTIRARNDFSVTANRVVSTQERLAETLASPLLASDIGLKLSAYSFTGTEEDRLRVILAAEIDRSQNPGSKVALAYTVSDASGRTISTQLEPEVQTPVRADTRTQTYLGAVAASPGIYRIKLAVADDTGKSGSVEHTIRAQLTSAGQIHITDLLLGEDSAGGGGVNPTVSAEFKGNMLHAYVELHSEAPEPLKAASVALEIANGETTRAIDSVPARFGSDEPTRRVAEGAIPIALLPPGEYIARAVVSAGGAKLGQVSRPFRILHAAGAGAAAASGALTSSAPIPFVSRIESFERTSVLTPPVVGFFLDRMNVGSNAAAAPPAAIEAARAGRFDEAVEALDKAPGNRLAPVFVGGLALYAKGDLEAAAAKFRESLRIDSEFFPAAFYLGACYAAGGHDQEAAGAWQTSLITQGDAPFVYTLLGDAFLRLQQVDAAIDILKEASTLWPGRGEVQLRLGTAYAQAHRPVDAVQTLDPYLAQHPEDQERLFIALRALYEARSAGKAVGTVEEDRQRFDRYAAAYARTGGPQQGLVEQWRKFISK